MIQARFVRMYNAMGIPLFFSMENTSTFQIHNAVKTAWKQFDANLKERYQRYWCEILFEADDIDGYTLAFLGEVNRTASEGQLSPENLQQIIARWHEDMVDQRSVRQGKEEPGSSKLAEDLFRELGI